MIEHNSTEDPYYWESLDKLVEVEVTVYGIFQNLLLDHARRRRGVNMMVKGRARRWVQTTPFAVDMGDSEPLLVRLCEVREQHDHGIVTWPSVDIEAPDDDIQIVGQFDARQPIRRWPLLYRNERFEPLNLTDILCANIEELAAEQARYAVLLKFVAQTATTQTSGASWQ